MSAWTLCSCLAPQIETFIKLRQLSAIALTGISPPPLI